MKKVDVKCPMCESIYFYVKEWSWSARQGRRAPYGKCITCKWKGWLTVKEE